MNIKNILKNLNHRPVAFYPIYVKVSGNFEAGVLLSQLMYWHSVSNEEWFYKTNEDMRSETHMSLYAVKKSKNILKKKNIIRTKVEGLPAKTYYKINTDYLLILLSDPQLDEDGPSKEAGPQSVEGEPTVRSEMNQLSGSPSTDLYTETTTENTTENKLQCKSDNLHEPDDFTPKQNQPFGLDNQEQQPKGKEKRNIPPPVDTVLENFNIFWDKYGRKKAKENSKVAFRRLSKADRQKAIDMIPAYHAELGDKKGTTLHMLPTTWLRGKRFNDEFTPADKPVTGSPKYILIINHLKKNFPDLYRKHIPTETEIQTILGFQSRWVMQDANRFASLAEKTYEAMTDEPWNITKLGFDKFFIKKIKEIYG